MGLKIAMISTAGYRTPPEGYGGEVFVWHLVRALEKQNEVESVDLYATYDSFKPSKGKLFPLKKGLDNWEQILNSENDVIRYYSKKIENSYGKPQKIEWAIENDNVFIVQSKTLN